MKTSITDNRIDDNKRSYAFNLGNKLVDQMFTRENGYTNPKLAKELAKEKNVITRYMLEAFIEGYIIAKEKSEERIGDKIIW